MLWDRNFWGELADDKIVPERPYVLVYMTTTDKKNIKDAISYGKEHNMPVYYLNFNRPVRGLHNISPMTVGEWIALFKNADTVFSASYHGLVFSLYFQKKLFYYNRGNKAHPSLNSSQSMAVSAHDIHSDVSELFQAGHHHEEPVSLHRYHKHPLPSVQHALRDK